MDTDDILNNGEGSKVHPFVKNAVVVALWLPLVAVLWAIGIASVWLAYRIGRYGTLPETGSLAAALPDSQLGVLGLILAIGYLYLLISNVTFGSDAVESTTEQAQEIRDEVEEE